MAAILAFVGNHPIGIVQGLGAVYQVEVHRERLGLFAADGVFEVHRSYVQTFEQRVDVSLFHLCEILRHLGIHGVVQIGANAEGIIFLNAALDQEEAHLGTLKKSLQFEIRIDGAYGIDSGRQRTRGPAG